MPDHDPIEYRLRLHTKRTDLPSDVLRDIGEAYAYINDLHGRIRMLREGFEGCCTACEPVGAMNQKLRQEVERLRVIMQGWEHSPMADIVKRLRIAWEAMGEMANAERAEAAAEIERLCAERDKARREVCRLDAEARGRDARAAEMSSWFHSPKQTAEERGWDCFKENTDAKPAGTTP